MYTSLEKTRSRWKVWHWDGEIPLRMTKWRIRERADISRHSSFKEFLVVPAVRVIGPIHNRAIVSFKNLGEYSFLLLNWSHLSLSLARSLIHGFRFGTVSAELSKLPGCQMGTCMCKSHPCSRPVWILFRVLFLDLYGDKRIWSVEKGPLRNLTLKTIRLRLILPLNFTLKEIERSLEWEYGKRRERVCNVAGWDG